MFSNTVSGGKFVNSGAVEANAVPADVEIETADAAFAGDAGERLVAPGAEAGGGKFFCGITGAADGLVAWTPDKFFADVSILAGDDGTMEELRDLRSRMEITHAMTRMAARSPILFLILLPKLFGASVSRVTQCSQSLSRE
jgi:hypothetical protein